jgi:hypothetical protein
MSARLSLLARHFTVLASLSLVLASVLVGLGPGPEPAAGAASSSKSTERLLARLSQSVALRYWTLNPDQAPDILKGRLKAATDSARKGGAKPSLCAVSGGVFNCDATGLPQNEESVSACASNTSIVLGSTNDYRGILDPEFNFTGWHLSLDGGATVRNEGLLPSVALLSDPKHKVPSGGDPVDIADAECNFFAASLAYDPFDPFTKPNGIAVYRSDAGTLASCPGGSQQSCWPKRRLAVEAEPGHFLDKEWIHVGVSDGTTYLWAVWSDFVVDLNAPLGFTSASVKAARCDADLKACTSPIAISTVDADVQFGDVTVGPDGRTYVSWARIDGELEFQPQTFTIKVRVAEPGSTTFGPERVVYSETLAIPFGGFLHANDFRVATYPKNDVVMVGGHPRIFVVWDACAVRRFGSICEEPIIKLTYSDNGGASWSGPLALSSGGDNYFPTIAADRPAGKLAIAWFTNSFDGAFHNMQDVVLATIDAAAPAAVAATRLTASNETEADPLLGGFFIGDYIEAWANNGVVFVHYNANHRKVPLLGTGFAINQQDNFLVRK